jgi:sarcosine oxidase
LPRSAAVVGAGILGLSTARALAADGFQVTVHEQHAVGTRLGGSPGPSRIFRTSYGEPDYVRLARMAIDEWDRLDDPRLLIRSGLLEVGAVQTTLNAEALTACGEPFEWLEPAEAVRRFPEARFREPALFTADAGTVRADLALDRLRRGLDVREGDRVVDPRALEADVVCVCAGAWLGRLFDLPLRVQLEQVAYVEAPEEPRPSFIDHGGGTVPGVYYALTTPGVGYKLAEDDGQPEPFDPERSDRPVDPAGLDRIRGWLAATFPGLDGPLIRSESCLYAMTPERDFILDTIDGIVVLGGDSGHAFKFGPLLGRLAADLAQGNELPAECARFRVDRFAGG